MFFYSNISTNIVYFIILLSILQASREKIRPTAKTIAAEREPSQHFTVCVAGQIW